MMCVCACVAVTGGESARVRLAAGGTERRGRPVRQTILLLPLWCLLSLVYCNIISRMRPWTLTPWNETHRITMDIRRHYCVE